MSCIADVSHQHREKGDFQIVVKGYWSIEEYSLVG
jgi:hypothetical protein